MSCTPTMIPYLTIKTCSFWIGNKIKNMSSLVYIYNDYVLNGHVQILRKKGKMNGIEKRDWECIFRELIYLTWPNLYNNIYIKLYTINKLHKKRRQFQKYAVNSCLVVLAVGWVLLLCIYSGKTEGVWTLAQISTAD